MITETASRANFIGGSEANMIYMGYDTKTFKQWWQTKIEGIDEESPHNLHMAVGTILERDVLDLHESIHGTTGERDGCSIKGIARANTDYVTNDKVSDVKVSTKAQEWHKKGKVPIQYRRQLIHYCYVLNMSQASIIAYQSSEELLNNPFIDLSENDLYEIEVEIKESDIKKHQQIIEYLELCKENGLYPQEG